MAQILLDNLSLTFTLRQHARITFKEWVVRRLTGRTVNAAIEVQAIKNLSLDIRKGERLGIIGHNGAGKSTLLKVLAGIYPPTSGRITVEGNISSLFEISRGFE